MLKLFIITTYLVICAQARIVWPNPPSWYDAYKDKWNFTMAIRACHHRQNAVHKKDMLAIVKNESDFEVMRHRIDFFWDHEAPRMHWVGLKQKNFQWRWIDKTPFKYNHRMLDKR